MPSIAHPALYGALSEPDRSTQAALWKPLLALLAARPSTWSLADDTDDSSNAESDDDEADDALRPVANLFLSWIELGCRASANLPAVVVLLSSLSKQVRMLVACFS